MALGYLLHPFYIGIGQPGIIVEWINKLLSPKHQIKQEKQGPILFIWLSIIADNTFHLIINHFVIKYNSEIPVYISLPLFIIVFAVILFQVADLLKTWSISPTST